MSSNGTVARLRTFDFQSENAGSIPVVGTLDETVLL